MYQNLILLVEGKENQSALTHLCETLLAADETAQKNEFTIFRWNVQHNYWQKKGRKMARSIDSVVLPQDTKQKILTDMDEFLTRETYAWYTEHGIPYKRSYLFYGVPGGGKTSLLQALAGKYRRNLCILQPTDPRFTDDKLADAIKDAPSRSILVLEDVDALFAKDRSACTGKLQITFSGLLNALDGISNPDGQIFILTTNFRDQLDAALIRNGRVDLHLEFTHAQPEQMRQLFLQFYPAASQTLAAAFADNLVAVLGERRVNMAALQHYFIGHRRSSAEEAAAGVQRVLEDMEEKAVEAKQQDEQRQRAEAAKQAAAEEIQGTAASKPRDGAAKKSGGAGTVHVHIHTNACGGEDE
jgi:chaperone BCS1